MNLTMSHTVRKTTLRGKLTEQDQGFGASNLLLSFCLPGVLASLKVCLDGGLFSGWVVHLSVCPAGDFPG